MLVKLEKTLKKVQKEQKSLFQLLVPKVLVMWELYCFPLTKQLLERIQMYFY